MEYAIGLVVILVWAIIQAYWPWFLLGTANFTLISWLWSGKTKEGIQVGLGISFIAILFVILFIVVTELPKMH